MEQPYDFIREQKALYQPKTEPAIIEVPEMTFFAVEGRGNPNELEGPYAEAVQLLYALSYTIKMSGKGKTRLPGFFDYRVPPLEGLWQMAGGKPGVDYDNKAEFEWTSMIRQPSLWKRRRSTGRAARCAERRGSILPVRGCFATERGFAYRCCTSAPTTRNPRAWRAWTRTSRIMGIAAISANASITKSIWAIQGRPRRRS